ncbi:MULTISPECIES: helix-turn-helix domain-containing protein [unclassified Arthrobacter]|uniref:helix-turn-helix domain-containing protein n=1 Tax=unclassified Arthrobacter TaxID=235627 RepID=UPI00366B8142
MIEYRAQSSDAWEALCTEQFQLCTVDWAAPSFGAGIKATSVIPDLSLHLLAAGPFGVSRTPIQTRRHDSDDLMIVFQEGGGQGRVEHKGERSLLGPGDAVLIDTRLPYLFDFTTPLQQTVVKVPRATASRLEAEAGRVVHAHGSPVGRALRAVLLELVELDGTGSPAGDAGLSDGGQGVAATSMASAALDLLAGVYAADPSRRRGLLGHEALLRAAQDFILARYRDPLLGPDRVAAHLGISPRLLAKIFSNAGTSPATFIRDTRMKAAAHLLRAPAHRSTAIFDIGLRVGFPDPTSFTRAFKRAYGMVPSDFRADSPAP